MAIGTPVGLGSGTAGLASTVTMTTGANIVSGDLVVVEIGINSNPFRTVASLSDGTNTYSQAVAANGAQGSAEIWYKQNAAAVSSGATITATLSAAISGGGNGATISAARVTGVATSSALDKIASQASTTSTPSVTTATLSQADEISFAVSSISDGTSPSYTESAGFTNLYKLNHVITSALSYRTVAATTAITYAPTWGVSNQAPTMIATFLAGSTAYSLTASVASFLLTGIATTLIKSKILTAATAAFTFTGIAVRFPNYFLAAAKATFTLTGVSVTIGRALKILASPAAFVLTGIAATLRKGLNLIAGAASFTLTGKALVVAVIVAPANKFKLRIAKFRLQKLRAEQPNLDD